MRLMSQVRMTVARRPWIHWAIVVALAAIIGASVAVGLAGVRRERAAWGTSTSVYVATRDIAPGEPLPGSVERRDVPLALVPRSAVTVLDADSSATQRLAAGEIIVAVDVAASSGPLALLPAGWLAITVTDVANPALFRVGDEAAVLGGGQTLAAAATVIAVTAADIVVAVPAGEAPAVASAAKERTAVVALRAAG